MKTMEVIASGTGLLTLENALQQSNVVYCAKKFINTHILYTIEEVGVGLRPDGLKLTIHVWCECQWCQMFSGLFADVAAMWQLESVPVYWLPSYLQPGSYPVDVLVY